MGWNDVKRAYKAPTEGEWRKEEAIGCGITDWTLKCGAFEARIRHTHGELCRLFINNHPYMQSPVLNDVMRRAEEEIIRRVDAVLPAYEIVKARLAKRPPASTKATADD